MSTGFRNVFPRTILAWMALALLGALPACAAPAPAPLHGEIAGRMPVSISEASGLAVSRRDARLLWTHSDSGGQPVLHAIESNGAIRGSVRVEGARNIDWEDVASFTLDGRAWLLIADTGDNNAKRANCALHVIPEPSPADLSPERELLVPIAWSIPVRYEDGPRDCEAVAVDAREEQVYLLAKRVTPHGLYTLPLRAASGAGQNPIARRVGELPAFPAAPDSLRRLLIPSGQYRAQPTGMDFSADGSTAAIVTYGEVLVYSRRQHESWAEALLRPARAQASHGLAQAEAIAFSQDATELFVASEGPHTAILRYRLKP